jgi:hypothetical protein
VRFDWQQFVDPIDGIVIYFLKRISEPLKRLYPMKLACTQQGVEHGATLHRSVAAGK